MRKSDKKASEVTPHHKHKTKLIKQDAERKDSINLVDTWLELRPNKHDRLGGKAVLRRLMSNGNVHTAYVGRINRCGEIIEHYKSIGKFGDPRK